MKRFTKWIKLDKRAEHQSEESKMSVVQALMRLYAHQTDAAIKDLKELCRVNPDFTSPNSNLRNDLEFYVPQISTFFLRGDLEDP